MASVRKKGKYFYYRVSIRENGYIKHIEHGGFPTYEAALAAGLRDYPLRRSSKPFMLTNHLVQIIFERFPEGSSAHIPLHLIYYYNVSCEEAYNISFKDIDFDLRRWIVNGREIYLNNSTIKLLQRQKYRIGQAQMLYNHIVQGEYVNIYLNNGKKIDKQSIWYVTRVIRKQINPEFSINKFSQNLQCP